MGSKNAFNFVITAITIYLLSALPKVFYGQNPDSPKEPNETKTVVEQALKDFETQKQNDQNEFKAQLNFRLGQVTKNWMASAENKRENQLDTIIDQEWNKQARIAMILPVNFEYYLRGYKYSLKDSDIIKTESIFGPAYKAVVIIKEELYAEKSHHGSASDIKPYLYTITHIYTLNFVYKDGDFTLVNSDAKMESMVNEISNEVRKEWLWQWL